MACNCKAIKKITQNNRNNTEGYEKKGVKYFIDLMSNSFSNLIEKILTTLIILIATPIIILMLIFSYVFSDTFKIFLPKKLLRVYKKVTENG